MELKFKQINNSTANFVAWLKGFKDIQPNLLLEVDLVEKAFVAKCFPPEKSIVKYSRITFEDAGYELMFINDNEGNEVNDWTGSSYGTAFPSASRVKVGIYNILSKFIDVFATFSESEHIMSIKFDVCNNVKYIQDSKNIYTEYQAETITLHSMSLTLNIKCSVLSEYFYKCDDDTFMNIVCYIKESEIFELTSETISNLIKISSVFTIDKSRDAIKFYSKKADDGNWALYAYDESNNAYDYLLGYYTEGNACETSTVIFRENFINATKGINGIIRITLDTQNSSRILIDAGTSKIVVAAVQNR